MSFGASSSPEPLPPPAEAFIRYQVCRCGTTVGVYLITTHVQGAEPVEVTWCPACDTP